MTPKPRQQQFAWDANVDPKSAENTQTDVIPDPVPRPDNVKVTDLAAADQSPVEHAQEPTGMPNLAGKTIYVVDAFSLIYQVFHAMPPMSSPTGLPVGAVHGFTRDMLDLLQNRKPDYLICAFDHPGDTFRHELFTEYKGDRPEMPADLQPQIGLIRDMLQAMGIPVVEIAGFEADDVLATLAAEVERYGGDCYLVTGDKDCRQLISARTKIFNIRKNEVFDSESLRQVWGIRPDQVVDFQTLVGDPVDGVPGVPLVGPKLARELLEKFETLDRLYDHLPEVNGAKRRENLATYREQALVSRVLVRLRTDAPISLDWESARVARESRVDRRRAAILCADFGFRRLADRIGAGELSDAELDTSTPSAPPILCHRIQDNSQFDELINRLAVSDSIALWFDIKGSRPHELKLTAFAIAVGHEEGWYVAMGDADQGNCELPWRWLNQLLRSIGDRGVGHNVKRYLNVLSQLGIASRPVIHDILVADYLLHAGQRSHDLAEQARRYLPPTFELSGGTSDAAGSSSSPDTDAAKAVQAASAIWQLRALLWDELRAEELFGLYESVELPLIEVLSSIEMHGIAIDRPRLERLSQQLESKLAELQSEIYVQARGPFNIDSPTQLAKILFDDLGLRCVKKTKTGRSTDAEVLEELAEEHPLPRLIVEYRQLGKLKSTYADALPQAINHSTGRIHTTLMQDVAATGRLSSQDPNLQNIPIRSSLGSEIRSSFIAGEPGWKLLAADYSQIELRVLAHFCSDATLRSAFAQDEDIHRRVAAEVFGVSPEQVTPEMRRAAKGVNFGIIYGQSPFGLAKSLGISTSEADAFIQAYFARYPGVDDFIFQVLEGASQTGYVKTILGRRRVIQGVRSPSRRNPSRQKNLPERLAINTIIQGSAADLIKIAMIRIQRRLAQESLRARMLLQIHDELLFEAPPDELPPLARWVNLEMSGVWQLQVPLKVDLKSGTNWSDCEPM